MNDETNPQEENAAPETASAEAAPAPASAGPLSEKEYAETIAPLADGNAKKAVTWLGKVVKKGAAGGQKLPGLDALDPAKKAAYKKFTQDENWAPQRDMLRKRLQVWLEMVESNEDRDDLIEAVEDKAKKLEELLEENLSTVFEEIRPVEETYRSVHGFFQNAQVEAGEAVDAHFYNCGLDQFLDSDDTEAFDKLFKDIAEEYKHFDLQEVFSMLVMPGRALSVSEIDRVAKQCEQFKVQAFADVENYETFEEFQDDTEVTLKGARASAEDRRYFSLVGNHLLGREKHEFEDEDCWISPASHVAGLIYKTDLTHGPQEVAAGYKKGKIQGPLRARFKVNQETAGAMDIKTGVIPITNWDNMPHVMGASNLNAEDGLNFYSRTRTEDWILKNVMQYLNKQTFENVSSRLIDAVKGDLTKFLRSHTGSDKALDDFDIKVEPVREPGKHDQVDVKLELKFKQVVRTYNVKVTDKGKTELE